MKLSKLVLILLLCVLFAHTVALACRYNVRDIGFIDVGINPYRLYGFVDDNTPADITAGFDQILRASLIETNIKPEVVNIDFVPTHPAKKYLDKLNIKSFPAAVLISPDEKTRLITLPENDQSFKQNLLNLLEELISSPLREKILQHTLNNFAVVLLVEGPDQNQNTELAEVASDALARISEQMKLMPKKIENPPHLVILKNQNFQQEKILLWTLDLTPEKIDQAYAAVFYGKLRRMGPVLKGSEITTQRLMNFLSVVGADCECGLDRSWMLGPNLPFRWDTSLEPELVKSLGFDPENPMVKMEVSRILRFSLTQPSNSQDIDAFAGQSLGYQEIVVQFDLPPQQNTTSDSQQPDTVPDQPELQQTRVQNPPPQPATPQPVQPPPQQTTLPQTGIFRTNSLLLITSLAILIVLVGLFIVVRRRH
jgi:LPXTG-motif cell wall-anchored protein